MAGVTINDHLKLQSKSHKLDIMTKQYSKLHHKLKENQPCKRHTARLEWMNLEIQERAELIEKC